MKLNSIKNHQRPSSIDVKVLSEWSSWRWFLGNIFGFAFQKKIWLLGCHCTVLMLWVVQAAARYFVFFSNQRNRPPTQLSCLKGSCAPWWFWRGVDWGWLDPLNPSFGLLALAQVQCYREYRGAGSLRAHFLDRFGRKFWIASGVAPGANCWVVLA